MNLSVALEMLEIFYSYGARKLTFIGGEPTLYGIKQQNKPLFDVINKAKSLGYKYLRLDTNGQFKEDLLHNDSFKTLDNLSFSFDGLTPETNNRIRGKNTFEKSIDRLKQAIDLGYYATITSCIHPENITQIEDMIDFFTEVGVKEFNMHPLFKMGIDRDDFSGDIHINPKQWVETYAYIRQNINQGKYKIPVRLPQRFIETSEYQANPDIYNYCPVKMGERILIHPNGEIRICALCIGSPYTIASYNTNKITFGAINSEISLDRVTRKPCMSQTKDFGDLTPLCISYKPFQLEHVWVTQHFDRKFLGSDDSTYAGHYE